MNALPLLAVGAGLLLLTGRKRGSSSSSSSSADDEPTTADDVERIVEESKDIIQGKRDSYSDDPGTKVDPREAAQRVKDTIEAGKKDASKVDQAGADELALRAAQEAAKQEATKQTSKPNPSTTTTTTKPKPATTKSLVVQVKQAQQHLNVLGYGLAVDGKYGPLTARAWNDAAVKRKKPGAFTRASPTTATVAKAAADAIANDAAKAKAKPVPPVPAPAPTPQPHSTPTPAPGPTPPPGFDRTKANRAAPDVAKHIKAKKYDYNRGALKTWQKLAGIDQDGVYGKGSAAALRYYVGASAPKALFAQGSDHYPWG